MSSLTQHKPEKARPWHLAALIAILLLAVFLNFYRLDAEGFANLYYAAGVKSMLSSWHNFFFVSFDPGGFVTVDKPPLGLWIQTISSNVFGFQGWSLLLPQALAGVLSVALLYHLVARLFGPSAGLIAALVLTLTPISVAANRNNTMDSLLVLTSLLGAWAASLAAERGRLRWLLLCALFVGIGFNIKMLQAFLVLPAFFLLYLFTAPIKWWKRIIHLALASLLLGIVALSWAIIVDSTPTDQRPYIGSSDDNTVMELIIGHNGAARLGGILRLFKPKPEPPFRPQPALQPNPRQPTAPPRPVRSPGSRSNETGSAGIFRLFNKQLAGQITWFLPLSFLCFFAAAGYRRLTWPLDPQHKALLLWGMWLLPQVIFFSFAGLFHRYYLEMLAPAIAALLGAGIVAMWRSYRWLLSSHMPESGDQSSIWTELRGWLLPMALLGSAVVETIILMHFPSYAKWIVPVLVGLVVISALGLIALLLLDQLHFIEKLIKSNPENKVKKRTNWAMVFTSMGIITLFLAPAFWSATPLLFAGDKGLPYAGPELKDARSANEIPDIERLVAFLESNRTNEDFLLGTVNARTASPFILFTGEPVMAIGGFTGSDSILSSQDLEAMVANGEIRFFLLPMTPRNPTFQQPAKRQPPQKKISEPQGWVQENCRVVPPRVWRPVAPVQGAEQFNGLNGFPELWDCGI